MGKRTVKKIVFHAIVRQLKETNRTQADIAADYNVSSSTVSAINQTATWGNYLAGVRATKPARANRAITKTTVTSKRDRAKAAGFNVHDREDRFTEQMQEYLDDIACHTQKNARDLARYATVQDLHRERLNASSSFQVALMRSKLFKFLFGRAVNRHLDSVEERE